MSIIRQAAKRRPPRSAEANTKITVAGTSNATAVDLTAYVGMYVTFKAQTQTVHVNFGDSSVATATTSHYPIAVDQSEEFYIQDESEAYLKHISGSTTAALHYFVSGE